jgi:hypothetical protein
MTPFHSVSGSACPQPLTKETNVAQQQREYAGNTTRSGNAGETEWSRVKSDCCDTEAGKAKPTLTALVEIGVSGDSLAITVTAQHACGIRSIGLSLRILEPGDSEPWTKEAEKNFDCPGNNKPIEHTFSWGAPPHKLPVNLVNCLITAVISATSCCSTSDMITVQARLKG